MTNALALHADVHAASASVGLGIDFPRASIEVQAEADWLAIRGPAGEGLERIRDTFAIAFLALRVLASLS